MSVLIDTNVLLRRAQSGHAASPVAVQSVARLLAQGTPVYFTPQNAIEFWSVATRPADRNGLGLAIEVVAAELTTLGELLRLLPDSPAVFTEWQRLVRIHRVIGSKVHDARLAAVANVYGVGSILTFNTDDFVRFQSLTVLHPSQI